MLTGKQNPQNVRAMCLVAEKLLRNIVQNCEFGSKEDMVKLLCHIASESKTAKLWVEVFLTPVFIMIFSEPRGKVIGHST